MRIQLARPAAAFQAEFLAAARRSRDLHRRWVAPPRTPEAYRQYLQRTRRANHEAYFLVERSTGRLVGVVNVCEIVLGPFRSAYLGYYLFEPYEGRGCMTEGLRLVVSRAFRRLRLHRLEANIQPDNHRSIRLVRRLGFRYEGFSPRYLKIAGRWRDHQRWAMLAEHWRPAAGRAGPASAGLSDAADPPP